MWVGLGSKWASGCNAAHKNDCLDVARGKASLLPHLTVSAFSS